jgi:serine/threonine protein kinase/Tol biopolymer transport system component
MTPERWQQVKEVLNGALHVAGEERAAFLGRACQTDPSLRIEVDALLASAPGVAEEFLKSAPPHRMQLSKGSRLGPYEIDCLVGTGGMGEVYRARDTRLGRVVAIKVYLEPLQTRFEREARAISALNHPNICTLYDIGPDYLVMELVEGQSLADRLKKGPLPIDKVLQYGAQIADALSTAHTQGIIHRDLKPGNVMETPKGIKLLDFGLAKYVTTDPSADTEITLTLQGAVLGTPAYMPPEQLEGHECDARTDIFALGLVLFEMATGCRAFGGSSQAQLISQIMHGEPAFEKVAPPAFRRLIERCLAKNPAQRWQTAADLKVALEDPATKTPSTRLTRGAFIATTKRRRLAWMVAVVGSALLVAALAWWWISNRPAQTIQNIKLIPLTTDPGVEQEPSLSPDGSQVAFSWNGPDQANFDIYVKTTKAGAAVAAPPLRLTRDPADDRNPVWSPDGSSIAFLRRLNVGNQFGLMLTSALGGQERKLTEVSIPETGGFYSPYLAWTPDSQSLITTDQASARRPTALFLVSGRTGEKQQLTFPPSGVIGDHCPAVSPDGKSLAFRRAHAKGNWRGTIYLLGLDIDGKARGEPREVVLAPWVATPNEVFHWACVAWTADSRKLVFSHNLSLWTQPLAPENRNPARGQAVMAVEVGSGLNFIGTSLTSPRLAYALTNGGGQTIWRMHIPNRHTKGEPPERMFASTKSEFADQYSPDGKKVAFESHRGGSLEIWVCESDGQGCAQLTTMGSSASGVPTWSPDGKQVAFYSNAQGNPQIFVIPSEGGATRRLTSLTAGAAFPRWSRDGKWIYFSSKESGAAQVWKAPSGGGQAVQVTHGGGLIASESPDGKWLYFSGEATDSSLRKMPVAGGEETEVLPSITSWNFAVMDDGVYFLTGAGHHFAIEFLSFATGKTEVLAPVGAAYFGFSVSPDRKWILYDQEVPPSSELVLAEGLK